MTSIAVIIICSLFFVFPSTSDEGNKDAQEAARLRDLRGRIFVFLQSSTSCDQINLFSCASNTKKKSVNEMCQTSVEHFKTLTEDDRKLCPDVKEAAFRLRGLVYACTVKTPPTSRLNRLLRRDEIKTFRYCATPIVDGYNQAYRSLSLREEESSIRKSFRSSSKKSPPSSKSSSKSSESSKASSDSDETSVTIDIR